MMMMMIRCLHIRAQHTRYAILHLSVPSHDVTQISIDPSDCSIELCKPPRRDGLQADGLNSDEDYRMLAQLGSAVKVCYSLTGIL